MSNNKDEIKEACLRVIEEMKHGDYADPEGKHTHFFKQTSEVQEEILDDLLSIDGYLTRPVSEIVDKAIDNAFVRVV